MAKSSYQVPAALVNERLGQVAPLVSRTLASLDEINDEFAAMRSGSTLRTVLLFPDL